MTAPEFVLVSVICWPTIGGEIGVEGHHEGLEMLLLGGVEAEERRAEKRNTESIAAVVQKAEAADLIALVGERSVDADAAAAGIRDARTCRSSDTRCAGAGS